MKYGEICSNLHIERCNRLDWWKEEDYCDEECPGDSDVIDRLRVSAETERTLSDVDFVFV